MSVYIDKIDTNYVSITGQIIKKYFDVDSNNYNYCKLIVSSKRFARKKYETTTIKCYLYNKLYNLTKNNGYVIGDHVVIKGELQNRNNEVIIFIHKIKKENSYEKNNEEN